MSWDGSGSPSRVDSPGKGRVTRLRVVCRGWCKSKPQTCKFDNWSSCVRASEVRESPGSLGLTRWGACRLYTCGCDLCSTNPIRTQEDKLEDPLNYKKTCSPILLSLIIILSQNPCISFTDFWPKHVPHPLTN
jgi:hypothetical protein